MANRWNILLTFAITYLWLISETSASWRVFYCQDKLSPQNCEFYSQAGYCKTHKKSLHRLCRRSCGLCAWGLVKKEEGCEDQENYFTCAYLKQNGVCKTHPTVMTSRCASTCGLCKAHKSCKGVKCPNGQVCHLNDSNEPQCVCPKYCPHKKRYQQLGAVCGADGATYKDVCHIQRHVCKKQITNSVQFYGTCESKFSKCDDSPLERDSGNCEAWKKLGLCESQPNIMLQYCKKTCGKCPDPKQPFPPRFCSSTRYGCCWDGSVAKGDNFKGCRPCKDRYPDLCVTFIFDCKSSVYKNRIFMKRNCPMTCGFCIPNRVQPIQLSVYTPGGQRRFTSRTRARQ